jgi:tRNA pseudouridine32 synthase/23S rRNA pseudouridine746 synthase
MPPAERPDISILDFLTARFPHIGRDTWEARLRDGKISDETGAPVSASTPYQPCRRLFYHREVPDEREIPFIEEIVFQNDHLLVACKPHFLPVTPSGQYVNECLLYRLRKRTGNSDLVAVNRLDRETAGLVLFSANPETRARYYELFKNGAVRKVYEAVAGLPRSPDKREWLIESRIEDGEPWFRSRNAPGPVNARTRIRLVEIRGDRGLFELEPFTGKHHQLRLHMALLGCPIENDPYYPELEPEPKKGFDAPLQLLARDLSFKDPVSGADLAFRSGRRLSGLSRV